MLMQKSQVLEVKMVKKDNLILMFSKLTMESGGKELYPQIQH